MASALHLRPLPQYRPPESRAGRGGSRALRLVALAASLLLVAPSLGACGGGNDKPAATAGASPTAAQKVLTAAGLVPDLASLGFKLAQSERDPAALPGQDAHRALFQQPTGTQMAARVDIVVLASTADATKQWETTSQAMRNPPPDIFGSASSQKDAPPLNVADQAKAYITARPDSNGTQVWTDVYRFGRVVTVVQVLGRNEAEAQKARAGIADQIRQKAN